MSSILIWDAEGLPPPHAGKTVLWRAFVTDSTQDCISIPQFVEENASSLRSRYLAWIYELGASNVQGSSLVEHLQLQSNFNYWWMTLLVEKSNFSKSPHIDDSIRLLAFSDWIAGQSITRIILTSTNRPLAECLHTWSEKVGVQFEWRRPIESKAQLSWLRRGFSLLPALLQACLWLLKYISERWVLRGEGVQAWRQSAGGVTFFSYLFNLTPKAAVSGKYESNYWGPLPEALRRKGCKSRWLHLYVKDACVPNSKKAAEIIRSFNETSKGMEVHTALDSFLSLRVVLNAIKNWLSLAWRGKYLHKFIINASKERFDLWPLHADDWRKSTCGVTAITNALYSNLFYVALKDLPKQEVGCYLQENQGWEFALIQHWKSADQGLLIGSPHSLVRFWDLRYFFDPRNYCQDNDMPMPLPDLVAVNGPSATNAYLQGGYPTNKLIQVEALRYLYLDKYEIQLNRSEEFKFNGLRLLVIGDYQASNTRLQMRLLAEAAEVLPIGTVITVKPHPACPINLQDYPELQFTLSMEPLSDLLRACDVAYTGAATAASVDAYCAGVFVISVADPAAMNLSALRGLLDVQYISTSDQLASAINLFFTTEKSERIAQPFFNLDNRINLWRSIFSC
jgi:surface carbohydrate biosynthesis protein (TIGR04326 family)